MYYAVTYSNSLSHFGIKGQKWGVRRYRNYDGSLTQRGLDRYRKTEKNYEYSKNKYKATKEKYKQGQASKLDVKNAKYIMKEDKKTMNKYYKQLHKDYMADKGKELYREGKRISTRGKLFGQIASGAATATAILGYMGKADLAKKAALISAGSAATYGLINAYAELPFGDNARLRAYYAHKSLPDVKVKGESSKSSKSKSSKTANVATYSIDEKKLKSYGIDKSTVSSLQKKIHDGVDPKDMSDEEVAALWVITNQGKKQ